MANLQIKETFVLEGRGWVIAGEILAGEIFIGDFVTHHDGCDFEILGIEVLDKSIKLGIAYPAFILNASMVKSKGLDSTSDWVGKNVNIVAKNEKL